MPYTVRKKTHSFKNSDEGIKSFTEKFADILNESLIVLETTGGYEHFVAKTLYQKGYHVHRAHALRVKKFMDSLSIKAKTDGTDARGIAEYARERENRLELYQEKDQAQDRFSQLCNRRADLVKQRTAEKNRLKAPVTEHVLDSIQKHIAFLTEEIEAIETKLEEENVHEEACEILQTVPGIGKVVARTIMAFLPEIGHLTDREVASLTGLAPHPKQSGTLSKPGHIFGGRAIVRSVLFTAALSASRTKTRFGEFYQRLVEAGKKPIVAQTALARKIIVVANARLRDFYKEREGKPSQEQ